MTAGNDSNPPQDAAPPHVEPGTVTRLLEKATGGSVSASDELLRLVYNQLRAIAQIRMSNERQAHTLQATALVNEAYLKLLGRQDVHWAGRSHFFRAAAEAMRRILVDHARARNADKRGGGKAALAITSIAELGEDQNPSGMLALDEALTRLHEVDAQAAEVVRLRFFAGLTEEQTAEALSLSGRTVRRDWAFARGWLRDWLERNA